MNPDPHEEASDYTPTWGATLVKSLILGGGLYLLAFCVVMGVPGVWRFLVAHGIAHSTLEKLFAPFIYLARFL